MTGIRILIYQNIPGTIISLKLEILRQIFSECTSLLDICFNCLNITKCDWVDFTTYAGTVNKECERFKISSIMDAQFN